MAFSSFALSLLLALETTMIRIESEGTMARSTTDQISLTIKPLLDDCLVWAVHLRVAADATLAAYNGAGASVQVDREISIHGIEA